MTRPKRVIVALAATVILATATFVLRNSGLASRPLQALAAMPAGMGFAPHSAPDDGEVFLVDLSDAGPRWEGRYGNVVDNMIYHFGVYEKSEVLLLRRLLEQMGGSFVDVGANTGNHSFSLARYADEVHAVEPWPPVVARLHRASALNPNVTNVRIHPVGYAQEPGTLPFHAPPEGSFVVGSFDATFVPEGRGEPILLPLIDGDTHLARSGAGRVGVVKCDIEGYERHALEGLGRTLRRDRPAVLFELNLTEGGFQSLDQLRRTFPEDYRFYEVALDPPWMLDFVVVGWFYGSAATGRYRLSPLTDLHRTNALALPNERNLLPSL